MLCCSSLRCGGCVVLCYNILDSLSFQGAMDVIIAAVQWRSYDIRLGALKTIFISTIIIIYRVIYII